jgi:hypothetical protein
MVDEDVIGEKRDLTGENPAICDFCGQLVPRSSLFLRAGVPGVSEPVEVLRICTDCRTRVEQEEIPFDEEIAAGLQAAEA